MRSKKLILFDIDGTLVNTGGAATRAMTRTFENLFGIQNAFRGIRMSGRTDPLIFKEAVKAHGLNTDINRQLTEFNQRYLSLLRIEINQENPRKRVLPGVRSLLTALSRNEDIILGLQTGNVEEAARIKLIHFRLAHFFTIGGYGSDAEDRVEIVSIAKKKAEEAHSVSIPMDSVYIIGDTPQDIQCAQSHGARSVAVATGIDSIEELRGCKPDFLLLSLQNTEEVLDIFTT